MKWIFYLLLLANVVFFAYTQLDAGNGSAQFAHQFNVDKIKLLKPEETPAMKPVAKMETMIITTAAKPVVCLEWGSFASEEQARAQQALDKLQLGAKLGSRVVEEGTTYWVYIPPLKTKKDAENKISELKALGIGEYFLMQDNSPWRNAISLGVFKSEELARNYLAKIQAKGVKSAVIGERNLQVKRTLFQIRDAGGELANKLAELQRDFPGSELKAVDCPNPESTSVSR
ncbi:MAG: SPOR domain-containing protein [Burkholderiales bacterium]